MILSLFLLNLALLSPAPIKAYHIRAEDNRICRCAPGESCFPSQLTWAQLNASVHGHLVNVVPSAKFCDNIDCTEAEWQSAVFRAGVPGAMNQVILHYLGTKYAPSY